jgi:hypothetical protein
MNPFTTGKLYRFTKMKPAICPIYVKINNEWKGTTAGISDGDEYDFNDITLLCLDSIDHDHENAGYSGIFLAGDKIIGVSNTWVKEI